MGRKSVIKIGDVFEIPLSDGRKSYGQYIHKDFGGPIIRIFEYQTKPNEKIDLSKIDVSKLLFPPIYAGVFGAIRANVWKVVGELPIDDYKFVGFISNMPEFNVDPEKGIRVKRWFFWDGNKSTEIGETLPKKYLDYESTSVYPASLVIQRIETGFSPEDYAKRHNRFLTKDEVKKKYPKVKLD